MKFIFVLGLAFNSYTILAQSAALYFQKNRNNVAAMTAFFTQMPKGGDLHHHYSGSLYAEPLLQLAIDQDFYLDTLSMQVTKSPEANGNWVRFSTIQNAGSLDYFSERMLRQWSVKDYTPGFMPSDKLFFDSFEKFWPVIKNNFAQGLLEIKNRALQENLSYIETQLTSIPSKVDTRPLHGLNNRLRYLAGIKDEKQLFLLLDSAAGYLMDSGIYKEAIHFNKEIVQKMHEALSIDEDQFHMRYQNFVLRFMEPVDIFKQLLLSFISAENSPLLVGVNIVSPENGNTALKDYWLHMEMFRYCHLHYPTVQYSLHAGELKLGLVTPESLNWHIGAAVYTGLANRIGHGTSIALEANSYQLLRYMKAHQIPVEINLLSNEFILQVKWTQHPVSLYNQFKVPILICSDDAGILRTNLSEQYVLLATRYPEFSYADIKKIVYNSIRFSFIKDPLLKQALIQDLNKRFQIFESQFSNIP